MEDSFAIGDQLKTGKRAGDVRIVLFVEDEGRCGAHQRIGERDQADDQGGRADAHVPALLKQVRQFPILAPGRRCLAVKRSLNVGALRMRRRSMNICRWRSRGSRGVEPKNVGASVQHQSEHQSAF